MVQVKIWSSLAALTEQKTEVEVDASTLLELLDQLADRYPAIRQQLDRGVSVVIDGRIYNDGWLTPIVPDSKAVLLARLKGG